MSAKFDRLILDIYLVEEDWAVDCDSGKSVSAFTDPIKARMDFHEKLSEEIESASISRWRDNEVLVVDFGEDYVYSPIPYES